MGNFDFDSMLGHDIPCTCGRTHSTDVQKIYLGSDAIDVLVATVQEMGFSHPFVVSDLNTWKAAGEAVDAALRGAGIACAHIVLPYDEPIPDEHVIGEIFCAMPQETDLIVCAGSGTLNDTCKFISYRAKIDYIVFATAPSMDGWVSIGAPLIINHMKVTIDTHGPLAVFSDPAVLAASPAKMINAGVGDVLGKYTALIDWRFSRIVNGEYVCDATVDNVRKALDLVSSNAEAIASREPEAVLTVMEGLLLTGIAMAWIGNSRPASGCEHHMSHVMEMRLQIDGKKAVLHGAKVGIDLIYCLEMYRMLAEQKIDWEAARNRPFDKDAWTAFTRRVYKIAAPEIEALEDRTDKYNIAERNARLDVLEREWPRMVQMMRDELPSPDEIRRIYKVLGAPAKPSDVGIDHELFCDSIIAGRDVRTRWTMLQLLWDLGLDEEYVRRVHDLLEAESN